MTVICLDLDGTLEDSRDDMVAAIVRVREALDLPFRWPETWREHVHRGMPHLYANGFAEYLAEKGDAGLEAVKQLYAADYGTHIAARTRLYPGIAEALPALAERGPLALVTNKPQALSAMLLAALGVERHFSALIGGDTLPVHKPDPAMIAAACKRTGQADAIMIGDSAGDIRMARAAKTPVIWCAWGYAERPGPLAPDAVAEHPSVLPARVDRVLAARR